MSLKLKSGIRKSLKFVTEDLFCANMSCTVLPLQLPPHINSMGSGATLLVLHD
jgi:hypothetical protein